MQWHQYHRALLCIINHSAAAMHGSDPCRLHTSASSSSLSCNKHRRSPWEICTSTADSQCVAGQSACRDSCASGLYFKQKSPKASEHGSWGGKNQQDCCQRGSNHASSEAELAPTLSHQVPPTACRSPLTRVRARSAPGWAAAR